MEKHKKSSVSHLKDLYHSIDSLFFLTAGLMTWVEVLDVTSDPKVSSLIN